jgi:glycosyltransferase involved in cell wall biosynthesis
MSEDEKKTLPQISVVVPTYRRRELLRKCLSSLLNQDFPGDQYEIIVVEDGSDEGREVVESLPKGDVAVHYFQAPHRGHASTYDLGLDKARKEIVAFIDDDAKAPPTWLREIASVLAETRERGVAGVGGRISPDYPSEKLDACLTPRGDLIWSGYDVVVPGLPQVDFLPGANMAFWRSVLRDAGGFDRSFSRTISWRHETDVSLRVRSRGYRLVFDSKLVVLHRAARWTDLLERVRPLVVWSMVRDDAYFRAKNYGWQGVLGTILAAVRDTRARVLIGFMSMFLVIVQLVAWIPGAMRGLLRRSRELGILKRR